jgi:adhesin transport system membrane fusion protein
MSDQLAEDIAKPEPISQATHMFLALSVTACLAFGYWSYKGTLDIVSTAIGEVIPSSQVKTIQHLEGGIIRDILIREGMLVRKGQALVELEPTARDSEYGELLVRMASLQVTISWLKAELEGKEAPSFTNVMRTKYPQMVSQALKRFYARRKKDLGLITSQKEQVIQKQQDIREISARIKNRKTGLKLLNEQISISEELLKEELTNRYRHLDLLKDASKMKGKHSEDIESLAGARAALKEAQSKLQNINNERAVETNKELDGTLLQYKELTQRVLKFEDNLQRTILRSPVDGVVNVLHVATVGGVLGPGDSVADIVPAGDRLVIEAKLPTQDIGYVQVGQLAMIKLASMDAMRFGGLEGKVTTVSPDTLVSEDGIPFYRVRIETDQDHFQKGNLRYQLFPGMQVTASIQTGSRTVLEYIIDPFLNSAAAAMQER